MSKPLKRRTEKLKTFQMKKRDKRDKQFLNNVIPKKII